MPGGPAGPAWHGALLESRQRWRDFASLALDLAFETDAEGRLTFLAPDAPLGWAAEDLLGRPGRDLLAAPEPDPFALRAPARGLRAWLKQADGGCRCLSLSVAPLTDGAGRFAGLRGCGRDITEEALATEAQATALRRAEALQTLVRRIRRRVLAPQMLAAMLEALETALGCTGAAVLEWRPAGGTRVTHQRGADPAPLLAAAAPHAFQPRARFFQGPGGESMALLPHAPGTEPWHALLAWRAAGQQPFDADDQHMLVALSDLLFVVLGNHALQQRLERQARTDGLTGLLNRRAFLDDLTRRLHRLASDAAGAAGARGALVFIDLDNFKPINDRLGHEAGDAALVAIAALLRRLTRPTDIAARFGGDEFALWLDGADAEGAASRAAALCEAAGTLGSPGGGIPPISFSIGCAIRRPGAVETPETLIARADGAMYAAKRAGRNRWVVAGAEEPERHSAA
ncbi:sensor domain-containing diguanylate cyclase [Paracraurococcus lichenis]|uniref:diguanylate cyclase n=1 Tax=Paracraurococcus lichenis TaxID=3064888 RepID=A0ABT9E757_9PROT|nr:sensor domain-containing diguanylate cyclase [Paracraurococcus sp. LOR1-02]MDO9712022.1 sensor domain-containing diguanylate cyclase [Paracraurococcus sp. LOR1-02]